MIFEHGHTIANTTMYIMLSDMQGQHSGVIFPYHFQGYFMAPHSIRISYIDFS